MKHIPNKILAVVLAASGAAFVPPAAAFMQFACVKNEMQAGTLMGARVHFKHYYQAKDVTDTGGKWRWRSSKIGPIVGKGKTSCVKLWKNNNVHVKSDTHFWVEAVTLSFFKNYRDSCGGVTKDGTRGGATAVGYTIKGSILTNRVCSGIKFWSEQHPQGCSSCKAGSL